MKKVLPVVGFFTAAAAAQKAYAESGSVDEAFVAAGRDVFMADVVEAPFKGFAELMGNVTGLDERRPEGTPTFDEMAERNRKSLMKKIDKWERDTLNNIRNFFRDLFD